MNLGEIRAAVTTAKPEFEAYLVELITLSQLDRSHIAKVLDASILEFLNSARAADSTITYDQVVAEIKNIWKKNLNL